MVGPHKLVYGNLREVPLTQFSKTRHFSQSTNHFNITLPDETGKLKKQHKYKYINKSLFYKSIFINGSFIKKNLYAEHSKKQVYFHSLHHNYLISCFFFLFFLPSSVTADLTSFQRISLEVNGYTFKGATFHFCLQSHLGSTLKEKDLLS